MNKEEYAWFDTTMSTKKYSRINLLNFTFSVIVKRKTKAFDTVNHDVVLVELLNSVGCKMMSVIRVIKMTLNVSHD